MVPRLASGDQPERPAETRQSYGMAWMATLVAIVVLLVVIVIVATIDGMSIASREQAIKVLEGNIPSREQVYPGAILAPPTVVTAPQSVHGGAPSDSAFVVPTVAAAPQSEVEGLVATVGPPKTTRSLRSGPGTEYAIVRELALGEQVQLLSTPIEISGQKWQLVRTSDDQVGWCMIHWLLPVGAGE